MIVGDYMGGVQFIQACNESQIFKQSNMKLGNIDTNKLDDKGTYVQGLRVLRSQINKSNMTFCFLRKPTSNWIREANELMQSDIDHKRLRFAGRPMGDDYNRMQKSNIPILSLRFMPLSKNDRGLDEYDSAAAKNHEFIEHQESMINLTKGECALILVTSTATGSQRFDLPPNLRNQTGANKTRKDSYSALLLGNWGCKVYNDMMGPDIEYNEDFTPMFL